LRLSGLGQQVAELYGSPQDIEWALVDHSLYLLQARPVTSLFPIPERIPEGQLKVLFSFAAVQGIMDPITPLGRDMICTIFAVGASLFGVQATSETQTALYTAGERLWGNITPLVRNSVGRRIFSAALGMVEPSVQQALLQIQDDPRLQPDRPGVSFAAVRQLLRFFLPVASNVFLNLLRPKERREMIVGNGERVLAKLQRRCTAIQGDRYERLAQQADLLPRLIREELPRAFILFVSSVAAAMASFNLLGRLAAGEAVSSQDLHDLVLEATRGVPHNPTTEMDLELWRAASEIRRDPASCELFRAGSPAELSARFLREELPQVAQKAVAGFLEKYGQRGLGEIDLGRARWREDPTPIFESLSGYLQIEAEEQAPDAVYARGARNAETAVDRLVETIRRRRFGWLKARLARFFASRMRELMGTRESPKFFVVRMMGLQRQELLKSGSEFVQAGELSQADDLFFLTFSELRRLAAHEESDWQARIERRREAYNRELMRRQVPRLLLSDGRAFYEGVAVHEHQAGKLAGSPVSPGSVEGAVRVVFDPRRANLQPGEILVCPGTDPSWTPLFLTAAGLVMETGGMMTHGAVVAREYGIPAVVGVDRATSRLQTGQRIQLNGSTGEITLLDSLP
jgi:pyruvate,water dikinase